MSALNSVRLDQCIEHFEKTFLSINDKFYHENVAREAKEELSALYSRIDELDDNEDIEFREYDDCPKCGGTVGHRINCPDGSAFSNIYKSKGDEDSALDAYVLNHINNCGESDRQAAAEELSLLRKTIEGLQIDVANMNATIENLRYLRDVELTRVDKLRNYMITNNFATTEDIVLIEGD